MLPPIAESTLWLDSMEADKKRYMRDNLRVLEREIHKYDVETLTYALKTCIEAGAYNARMLMDVAEGERIRCKKPLLSRHFEMKANQRHDTVRSAEPEKSDISTYDDIINTAI